VKIAFIADFFSSHLLGGAEMNDAVLLSYLKESFDLETLHSKDISIDNIKEYDFLIISNFCMLDPPARDYIQENSQYVIYEHDHKYVSSRDPSNFTNFEIPEKHIMHRDFYKSAKKVICLGAKQVEIINKNLKIENLESISGSLWSQKKLMHLRDTSKAAQKNDKFAIVESTNPIKNTQKAISFCEKRHIKFDLIKSQDPYIFIDILSKYEGLVFFPAVLESMCRLVVEAKMLNCKIITTPKLLGAYYEPWFSLTGIPLINTMQENVKKALELFSSIIVE
jgi:hypothetical protein